ncbi:MAG: response regulator [Xanthomonadales bacterium]|nr:response regulator [Xanthomonadales bacterium]
MQVRFWGTRGSIATPGPATIHFGGNTACVEVTTSAGACFILDCGTGARALGAALVTNATKPIVATILLSHTHWDHIQGFPFFAPLFVPGNRITVCGPEGSGQSLREVLSGQMEFTYFPVEIAQLPATIIFRELGEGIHLIDGVKIIAQYLNHPAMTLGYRIEADGAAVVYLCDHEPFSPTLLHDSQEFSGFESIVHEGDRRHAQFMAGASLVIHDAQYTPEEYPSKKNWGHSTYEYAAEVAALAGVQQLILTHHDPIHDDSFVADIEKRARDYVRELGYEVDVCCAYEGLDLAVGPYSAPYLADKTLADKTLEDKTLGDKPLTDKSQTDKPLAPQADHDLLRGRRILVVDDDPDIRALASLALTQDGHTMIEASNGPDALALIAEQMPDLLVLDLQMPEQGGLEVLKILRSKPDTAALPVVVLTAMDDEETIRAGFELGATDYVTKPFSIPQLAARVRACLQRTE